MLCGKALLGGFVSGFYFFAIICSKPLDFSALGAILWVVMVRQADWEGYGDLARARDLVFGCC